MQEPIGRRETLIGDGNTDGEESLSIEPGSVFRCASRTYTSSLERDQKGPNLHKLTSRAGSWTCIRSMLLTPAYADDDTRKAEQLLAQVRRELDSVLERDAPKARG